MKIAIIKNEFFNKTSESLRQELCGLGIYLLREPPIRQFSMDVSENSVTLHLHLETKTFDQTASEPFLIFVHSHCVADEYYSLTTDLGMPQYGKGFVQAYTLRAVEGSKFYPVLFQHILQSEPTEATVSLLKKTVGDLATVPWCKEYVIEISLRLLRATPDSLERIQESLNSLSEIIGRNSETSDTRHGQDISPQSTMSQIWDTFHLIQQEFDKRNTSANEQGYWDIIVERPDLYQNMYNLLMALLADSEKQSSHLEGMQ